MEVYHKYTHVKLNVLYLLRKSCCRAAIMAGSDGMQQMGAGLNDNVVWNYARTNPSVCRISISDFHTYSRRTSENHWGRC